MTGNLTDPLKSFCPHDPPGGWAAAQREAVTLSGHLGLVSGGATLSSFFFFFLSFCLFRATPEACGGSQARGLIGGVATSLHHSHSNSGSEPRL